MEADKTPVVGRDAQFAGDPVGNGFLLGCRISPGPVEDDFSRAEEGFVVREDEDVAAEIPRGRGVGGREMGTAGEIGADAMHDALGVVDEGDVSGALSSLGRVDQR
jgi:hypothetical protein